MKKVICVIFLLIGIRVTACCQEYYRLGNTSVVFRFYGNQKTNVESINDSTTIVIIRKGSMFYITLKDQKGSSIGNCNYIYKNKDEYRDFIRRNTQEKGSEFIKSKRKIKVLEPVAENCLKGYLNR